MSDIDLEGPLPDDLLAKVAAEDDVVAAAVVEAADASELEGRLEQAYLDGDDTIDAKALSDANTTGRMARLRAQREARRVLKDRDEVRLGRLEELVGPGALEARFAGGHQVVLDRFDAAVEVLADLAGAVVDVNAELAKVVEELPNLEPLPVHVLPVTGSGGRGYLRLPLLDLQLDALDLVALVADAAWRATESNPRVPASVTAEFSRAGRVSETGQRDVAGNAVIAAMVARSGRDDRRLGAVDGVRRIAAELDEAAR